MKFQEIRKDQFEDLIGKFGKRDVLDVVPWERVEAHDFGDSGIIGTCLVYIARGEQHLQKIRVQYNASRLDQLLIILHETAHHAAIDHDRKFAAACWGLTLRAGLFDFYGWQAWVKTRNYDIGDDDKHGAAWAQNKAAQVARSNSIMFRLRYWRLGVSDLIFTKFAAVAAATCAMFTFIVSSYFR